MAKKKNKIINKALSALNLNAGAVNRGPDLSTYGTSPAMTATDALRREMVRFEGATVFSPMIVDDPVVSRPTDPMPTGLTVQALMDARDRMERDRLAARERERERQREMMREEERRILFGPGYHRRDRPMVDVRIDQRPDRGDEYQIRLTVGNFDLNGFFQPQEDHESVARRMANDLARRVECEAFETIMRTAQNPRRGWYDNAQAGLRHAMDIGRAMAYDGEYKKPETAAPFPFKEPPLAELSRDGFTAKLLADDMQVWEEADSMSHCLFKTYVNRMRAGEYAAYHISFNNDPNNKTLPRSGFTAGFRKRKDEWVFDQIRGQKNDTSHIRKDNVVSFYNHLQTQLNGGKEVNKPVPRPDWMDDPVRIEMRAGAARLIPEYNLFD